MVEIVLVVLGVVALEFDAFLGAFVAVWSVSEEGEVVVAVASEVEECVACVKIGTIIVGWECGLS